MKNSLKKLQFTSEELAWAMDVAKSCTTKEQLEMWESFLTKRYKAKRRAMVNNSSGRVPKIFNSRSCEYLFNSIMIYLHKGIRDMVNLPPYRTIRRVPRMILDERFNSKRDC